MSYRKSRKWTVERLEEQLKGKEDTWLATELVAHLKTLEEERAVASDKPKRKRGRPKKEKPAGKPEEKAVEKAAEPVAEPEDVLEKASAGALLEPKPEESEDEESKVEAPVVPKKKFVIKRKAS